MACSLLLSNVFIHAILNVHLLNFRSVFKTWSTNVIDKNFPPICPIDARSKIKSTGFCAIVYVSDRLKSSEILPFVYVSAEHRCDALRNGDFHSSFTHYRVTVIETVMRRAFNESWLTLMTVWVWLLYFTTGELVHAQSVYVRTYIFVWYVFMCFTSFLLEKKIIFSDSEILKPGTNLFRSIPIAALILLTLCSWIVVQCYTLLSHSYISL